ncbi:hypothetical protein [Desulfuribacillus alkaliarsenatis]|uniref:Peptidase S9 prolyl oligopeptidase catalytic domain-containing protein n=1 Tax=Desulfuribacillus alkaliarsenatis TaxID=766136 RepID=A0A1E5G3C9_9FIRM|nr:hypothetical protein [Desulfuribacillus alkaliarsenatis]OEF97588.1 hypothetical protein BHF68_14730 [Desulfuribacillus alkaliarsenatis]
MKNNKDNWHGLLDRLGATIGAYVYRKNLFFSESINTKPIKEVIPNTDLDMESIEHGDWQKVTATSPIGQFNGKYLVYKWIGNDVPTICFIHGSGEQPYKFDYFSSNSFRKIFTKEFDIDANLILLMAPFHEGTQNDYIKALDSLENYVGMLATTTVILDALASRLRVDGLQGKIYAVGVSLGGWVVNLHRAYFRGKVDYYVPMIAGTRLHDVFTTSNYSKLTARKALDNVEVLKEILDFEEDFLDNKKNDCYPLLARYDRLVELDVQKNGYKGMELKIINKGHFTGMEAITEFRNHIKNVILTR